MKALVVDDDPVIREVFRLRLRSLGHDVDAYGDAESAWPALEALGAGTPDPEFYQTKLATGRYYMARRLPMTATHLARIESGADTVMALDAANF